jgi:hypothetical protein
LVRNLSAFSTLFAPGKSWDNKRSTAAPYTESRLAHLVRNKCVGFPVVEQEGTTIKSVRIPIGFNAVADIRIQRFTANMDPDKGSQTNADPCGVDPDPVQTLPTQRLNF